MAVTHSNGGVKTTMGKESLTPWSRESCNGHANGQESKGASAVRVTESFLFPEHMRPTVKHDEFTTMEVPVIDLAAWGNRGDSHDDQDKEAAMASVVAQMRDACVNWGFFQIINHGVEEELLARIQRQADLFFNLPYAKKAKVSKPPGKYAGYGHATVKDGDARPWSEGFYFTDVDSTANLSHKIWPQDDNADFLESYREYDEKVRGVSELVMRIIVAGLDADPAHFQQYTAGTGGLLRWNWYPACAEPAKTLGLIEHTDFNLVTVLHQGHIGGLQILKDQRWIAVRPRPGALAVNLGDTLQVLTNDKYKSVPHRAVVNETQSRFSLVYFYVPLQDIDIVPAPELVDEDHPCKYKTFDFADITKTKQLYFLKTLDHFLKD